MEHPQQWVYSNLHCGLKTSTEITIHQTNPHEYCDDGCTVTTCQSHDGQTEKRAPKRAGRHPSSALARTAASYHDAWGQDAPHGLRFREHPNHHHPAAPLCQRDNTGALSRHSVRDDMVSNDQYYTHGDPAACPPGSDYPPPISGSQRDPAKPASAYQNLFALP